MLPWNSSDSELERTSENSASLFTKEKANSMWPQGSVSDPSPDSSSPVVGRGQGQCIPRESPFQRSLLSASGNEIPEGLLSLVSMESTLTTVDHAMISCSFCKHSGYSIKSLDNAKFSIV